MRAWLPLLLLALALAGPGGGARASETYAQRLAEAESVRSADPARFSALLGELTASIAEADAHQRDTLAYLKIYQLAYTGRFDMAIEQARRLYASTPYTDVKVRTAALAVNAHAATREFAEGLRLLAEILPRVDEVDDRDIRHHAFTVAAVIYNQVGQYELGLHYADRVLGDQATPRTACLTGFSRLEALYNLGLLADKEQSILELIAQCDTASEPLGAQFLRRYQAQLRADAGDRQAAIALLEQHLPAVTAMRYPRLTGEFESLLASLLLEEGRIEDAERHAQVALANGGGMLTSLPTVVARRVLFEVAMARGDIAQALAHHRDYAAADKAYLDEVQARALAFQIVSHETSQKTQQIELLNRQNDVLRLEQEVATRSSQAALLLVLLLAVLLAFIGYFAWKTKKTQLSFRRLAETDALTGVSNRHHFSRRAQELLDACQQSGEPAALVMFDLDEFKSVNDRFGHAVGDWVLQQVAASCREACRKRDLFGRLGGEEFAFLLAGCDLADGLALAEDYRARLARIDTSPTGHAFRITASFGVADTTGGGFDFLPLLARADAVMYRAKREGRDRVYGPPDVASA